MTPVTDLCKTIDSKTTSRLNLNVDGTSLFQLAETDLEMKGLENGKSVSLAEGFFGNETELDIDGKLCLAVVLSYSLLDFCGEPWFSDGWTKNGIFLLQHSGHLLLRPILVTYLRPTAKGSQPPRVESDLKLLFHGILLMEIFKQAPLPLQMNHGKDIDIDDLRKMARKEFDAVKWVFVNDSDNPWKLA